MPGVRAVSQGCESVSVAETRKVSRHAQPIRCLSANLNTQDIDFSAPPLSWADGLMDNNSRFFLSVIVTAPVLSRCQVPEQG